MERYIPVVKVNALEEIDRIILALKNVVAVGGSFFVEEALGRK